jgi:polyhydroxybutyrate depolymerase
VAALIAACSGTPSASTNLIVGGDRPVTVHVPATYDPRVAAPLLIGLHGYTSSGSELDAYLGLADAAEADGILTAYPDGTTDRGGQAFWNATDACCDFQGSGVDDSAYLATVIAEIQAEANVDPRRIYLVGHSNGGFMSYRMACDHAEVVAAIMSLAGATFAGADDCRPTVPVAVLQVHGTDDDVIRYAGGRIAGPYPGAVEGVGLWAAYDGCDATLVTMPQSIDLDAGLASSDGPDETTIAASTGCSPGGHVELWTIEGAGHVPDLAADFGQAVVEFLLDHPKP